MGSFIGIEIDWLEGIGMMNLFSCWLRKMVGEPRASFIGSFNLNLCIYCLLFRIFFGLSFIVLFIPYANIMLGC